MMVTGILFGSVAMVYWIDKVLGDGGCEEMKNVNKMDIFYGVPF